MKQDMIVILDLGSSENTKLARDIREMGVYSEIYPHDITASMAGFVLKNQGTPNIVFGVSGGVLAVKGINY